ncbi:efflux RND transporter permease subunit [Ponticaulis sp.]|uniref:efflux RND transporter permease subunit n=1 Tax=Ponticaulis sp. TaxID=2020902 RepID=UPI000B713D23|nr:efflux RND transporter permease subunit [Ponticaulis sp.]MAI90169.1 RND transporter [Ponticaulis sp.]OUX99820.1 MAG: RND transporter [Hyphomonadaceae bacterium TMED5]|tara:strand:- start:129093 stop:132311 length:3219 start_codon:yes stop_codon:yes gene_type:complete
MNTESQTEHKGIVAWWAKNSVAANLVMFVAIVFGIMGFNSLEREVFPAASFNGASVSISWPGASPNDIEDQIVTRLEEVLADMDGLKSMTGTAREGVGYVNLESYNDYDIDKFIDEVERRVAQISNLPQASFPAQVSRWRQEDQYLGIAVHGNVDRLTLKRVTDDLRDRFAALEGGELATVMGTLDEEVSIEVSEEALRRYGLTFSDVANAVSQSSINSSGGYVRTDVGSVRLQTRNLADTTEDFEDIIVRQLSSGETIRVGDVATVVDGFVDADLDTTHNGEPSAFIMIMMPETMYIDEYSDRMVAFIETANEEILPEAIRAELLFTQVDMFRGNMELLQSSAFIGMVLVLIVLLLFLRPIVAFWVTIGIMTAFAGGFALLPLFGVSLNILSFFAILLVIGVIVDDAIVVGENIHKEVESGRGSGVDAAIVGTQLVVKPVIFGVLTTMIMFSPWMLLPGPERQFTSQITYVVIAALSFSLIEAMLILPAHLAHMKPQRFDGASGVILRVQRSIADSLIWFAENLFKPVLELALRFRYATVALFLSMFMWAVGLLATNIVPAAIMPEIESNLVMVNIDLPNGTPFSRTEQVGDQLARGVEAARRSLAEQFPEVDGDIIEGVSIIVTDDDVQSFITTMLPEDRPISMTTEMIADAIREGTGPVPDAEEVRFQFTVNQNDGGYRVALSHPDLDLLQEATDMVKQQLSTYSSTYDIGDNLSSAAPELRFQLLPGAEALGVNLALVSTQVRQAFYGQEAQRLPRDGEDVRVMVRYPEADRRTLESLEDLRIRTADGREIPLDQVATYEFAPGIDRIYRRDRVRSAAVFAELQGDVRGQIMADMEANFWPRFEERFPDVIRGRLGDAESEQEFLQSLVMLNAAAIFVMYILLAIAFKSYFQPILLMMALPFSFAGAVFGHLFFGVPLAMFSIFGIAAAAGVVINDNLVLIDSVNRRRNEMGQGAVQALVESAVSRFRPILLTSITTFVGVLPMIAERSVQAQFLKPMVVSLGSAVAFALFVSLFFVPALYAVGAEMARIFRWLWNGQPYQHIGASYDSDAVAGVTERDDHLHHQPVE